MNVVVNILYTTGKRIQKIEYFFLKIKIEINFSLSALASFLACVSTILLMFIKIKFREDFEWD